MVLGRDLAGHGAEAGHEAQPEGLQRRAHGLEEGAAAAGAGKHALRLGSGEVRPTGVTGYGLGGGTGEAESGALHVVDGDVAGGDPAAAPARGGAGAADRGVDRGFLKAVDRDGAAGVVEDLLDDERGTLEL